MPKNYIITDEEQKDRDRHQRLVGVIIGLSLALITVWGMLGFLMITGAL